MSNPIELLENWLSAENKAGAPNPRQAVLATCGKEAMPHARVVALREITDSSLLFFTQLGTRKCHELTENPYATMTFWFELFQREVIIEGNVIALSEAENQHYWNQYPREAKIRFDSYAPTSAQPISAKAVIEDRKMRLEQDYRDQEIPFSQHYRGFRLQPERLLFYAYRTDELSDVFEYRKSDDTWIMQWLSP